MRKAIVVTFLVLLLAGCASEAQQRDLFVDAQSSRATANAADVKAQLQEQYLTATAEAPLIHITQTAAAQSVVSTQMVLDRTATAYAWTPTISPTPTNSPTPTPDITRTLTVALAVAQQTEIALQTERETSNNTFWTILPIVCFVIAVLVLGIVLVWVSRRERYRPAAVDARGNILPIIDYVDGTFTDIDRSPNFRGSIREKLAMQWLRKKLGLPSELPMITAERQDATTQRDQTVDLVTRAGATQGNNQIVRQARLDMAKQLSAPNMNGRFRILSEEDEWPTYVDAEAVKVLDNDWKEANRK